MEDLSFKRLLPLIFLISGCAPIFKSNVQDNYNFFNTQIKTLKNTSEEKTFFQITYLNSAYKGRYSDGEYFIVGFNKNSDEFFENRYAFYYTHCTLSYNDQTINPIKSITKEEFGNIPNYNEWTLFYLYKIPIVDNDSFELTFTYLGQDKVTLSFSKSL